MANSNLTRLQNAGLLELGTEGKSSDEQQQAIELLGEEEVSALIGFKDKLRSHARDTESLLIF